MDRASALFLVACLALLVPAGARAGELETLVQEYNAAKPKARGGKQEDRRKRVMDTLKPILMKIAKVDGPASQGFLVGEFQKEGTEVAAACVEPILALSSEKSHEALLAGLAKRDRVVKMEVLGALKGTKRSLASLEAGLIAYLAQETLPEARKEIPPVLGKVDTPGAAKALLNAVGGRPAKGAKGKAVEEAEEFDRRVFTAMKESKNPAVKDWLAGEAWTSAGPAKVGTLADLAGELKLEAARGELEKQIGSGDEGAAVRCLEALIRLGAGPSAGKIAESLKKGKRSLSFRIQALDSLAAAGTDESVAAVREAARDADPETRAIALGSLARVPGSNASAFEGISAGLKDSEGTVRASALRALARVRHKGMVPALIELLEAEKDERLRVNGLQFLVQLTGKNMGLVAEDWRKWWEVAEPKFEFVKDEKAVTASRAHDLKYFGIEISSKRLSLLVDASGSMTEMMDVYGSVEKEKEKVPEKQGEEGGTRAVEDKEEAAKKDAERKKGPKSRQKKIDVLKKEMARLVGDLPKDTQINMVTFAGNYQPWQDQLQPLAGGGREKALAFVRDIKTGSGTNVFDTLEFALRDKRVDTVFLLTDGLPTRGKYTDEPSILREAAALNRVRGVVIHCIAFGAESEFLKKLAQQNGGTYKYVDSY